jgi:FkbM family methyltransferase
VNAEVVTARLAARVPRSIAERIPAPARRAVGEIVYWASRPEYRRIVTLRDYLRICQLSAVPADGRPIEVRPKGLRAGAVRLRPGTSDAQVLFETLAGRYHLPRPGTTPRTVWDLGSNLGLTVAHFAELWPHARIVGLEPQPYLARAARELLLPYGSRCEIVEAAVWATDGSVSFSVEAGNEYGGRVDAERGYDVRALSLNTLLAEKGPADYVKMDIEGAEATVLRENTEWASHVNVVNVECHGEYTVDDCRRDLHELGFRTEVNALRISGVLGWRRP